MMLASTAFHLLPILFFNFAVNSQRMLKKNLRKDPMKNLLRDLFSDHDPRIRPVENRSEAINITMTMTLYQLIEVKCANGMSYRIRKTDKKLTKYFGKTVQLPPTIERTFTYFFLIENEPEEYVSLNVWLIQTWKDDYLSWDPAQYEGISYVVVPWQNVWLSDIVLYNGYGALRNLTDPRDHLHFWSPRLSSLDMSPAGSERRISIELRQTQEDPDRAHVRFAYPALYKFSCKLDVYYFPFDRQNCTMIFGSWVHDTASVDLWPHDEFVKMDNFNENQEWNVISFRTYRHVLNYSCCPEPYTNVQYHLVIQRKPLVFVCNFVVPTVIVAMVSMLGFFMPNNTFGEREEKINLGIATLLAMSILLLMVSDKIPTGGNYVPMMARFFLANIVIVAMATCMTTVVILIQRQGRYGKKISPSTRYLFFKSSLSAMLPLAYPFSMDVLQKAAAARSLSSDSAFSATGFMASELPRRSVSMRRATIAKRHASIRQSLADANDNDNERDNNIPKIMILESSPNGTIFTNSSVSHTQRQGHGGAHSLALGTVETPLEGGQKKDPFDEWEMLADIVERLLFFVFMIALVALLSFTMLHAYRFL